MGMPKKRNINITPDKFGENRVKELLDLTDPKTNYFPPGILFRDLDTGFRDFFRELNFTLNGEKVPIIFMPGERWSEFAKGWKYLDEDNNVIFPLITIRRLGPPEPGTSVITKWNIPGRKTFTYLTVPTWDGNYEGVQHYRIPQPVATDIKYSVQLFSHYITDLNKFGELLLTDFSSRQSYTKVKNRFMPIIMDGPPSDESTIEDFEGDRFHAQSWNFILQGYIQDPDEFEIVNGAKKVILLSEVDGDDPIISGITRAPLSFVNNLSLLFDGVDEFVNIDQAFSGVQTTTTGTWSAWIKPSAVDTSEFIIAFGSSLLDNLRLQTAVGKIQANSRIGISNKWILSTDSVVLSANTWSHIAIVQDGTEPKLYIDGVFEPQTFSTDTDKTVWFNGISGLNNGRIACQTLADVNSTFFTGNIDEVSIWNINLTAGEIGDIYNTGKPTNLLSHSKVSNLVSWYRMGDGDSFPILYDNKGSNTGTINNMEFDDIEVDSPQP